MNNWTDFHLYVYTSISFWIIGLLLIYINNKTRRQDLIAQSLIGAGTLTIALFLTLLWVHLERPPMRTLGETRLWYALLIPFIAQIYYIRWQQKWMLLYSIMMGVVFLMITYTKPEVYDKTLMPALQSPWFIPHVIVYMFAYAIFGVSCLIALKGLYQIRQNTFQISLMKSGDTLVYTGFAFLTLGLLFGALWAKEAWGHYWTWDPKETWALLTWLAYMLYIHIRFRYPKNYKSQLWILALSFVVLLVCWFGINFLTAAESSVHTY